MSEYRNAERPGKKGGSVKVNKSAFVTLFLIIAIVVLLVLIIKDLRTPEEPGTLVTDVYGGTVTLHTGGSTTEVPRRKRPVSDDPELLPIFYSADTDEKEVAITIGSLGSARNITDILELCDTYGAHVTFFPTGKELLSYSSVWGEVIFGGHEIENHGYSGDKLSSMGADGKRTEIGDFTYVLRNYIGEEYQPHFLRTNDLTDDENASIHAILMENGYYGIARWSCMSPTSIDDIHPGQVIAIDLNSYSVSHLNTMMSVLAESGYSMVTMNELFDYEPNLLSSEGTEA